MDKRILNHEELNYLRRFIKSRGFRDEGTIVEILDHFACKVEEVLMEHPDMQFEDAAGKAHQSFGVMGFKEIVTTYKKQLKRTYKNIYWTAFKGLLFHPIHAALLALIGFFSFQVYLWVDANNFRHIMGQNDFTSILLLSMIGYEILFFVLFWKNNFETLGMQLADQQGYLYFIPYWIFIMPGGEHQVRAGLTFDGVMHSIIVIYGICHCYARYRTLLAAREKESLYEQKAA